MSTVTVVASCSEDKVVQVTKGNTREAPAEATAIYIENGEMHECMMRENEFVHAVAVARK